MNVRYYFAHGFAKVPGSSNVGHTGGRQTNENDKDVTDGQVDYEHVGHCFHVRVFDHDQNHKQIPYNACHKYADRNEYEKAVEYIRKCE